MNKQMGVLKRTHAWSVAASVIVTSVAFGLVAVVILAPGSRVVTFMIAQAIALLIAVGINAYNIYRYERDRVLRHDALSAVQPQRCPDYWTEQYDSCSKSQVCKPYFSTENPAAPKVFMNGTSLADVNIKRHSALGPSSLCAENAVRSYPWMEVTNSCAARNGAG